MTPFCLYQVALAAAAVVAVADRRRWKNLNTRKRPIFFCGPSGLSLAVKFRARHFDGVDEREDRPLITQFCGNDPDTVVRAARHIEHKCDAVDLNLGCPQKIAKKARNKRSSQ